MTSLTENPIDPFGSPIEWVLRCAYLVAVGDAHLSDEEKERLRRIRGEVRRMLQAREAIEYAECTGDFEQARPLFDSASPIEHSFGDMLSGFLGEELGTVGIPSEILPLHEMRSPIKTQKALTALEQSVAREYDDPFLHKVAYFFCMDVAGDDDEFSDGERQSLQVMATQWDLTHGAAVDWYNNYAYPILTGDEPNNHDGGSESAELSSGVSDAVATLLADGEAGKQTMEEVLAELIRLTATGVDEALPAKTEASPIVSAIGSGGLSFVKDALDARPEISEELFEGISLLSHAVLGGQFEIAEELLRRGCNINLVANGRSTTLALAAMNGQETGVRFCLDHGADPNVPVSIAIAGGGGEEVLVHGFTPLHSAAGVENSANVELLISKGADPNAINDLGFSPLMHAIKDHQYDNEILLVDAGAALDFDPPTDLPVDHLAKLNPLLVSATNSNLPMVRLLLEKGVRVDVQDGSGSTALKHAAAAGNRAIVEALIRAGADVNLADEEDWTPLIAAAYREHAPIVRTLLENGADPNRSAIDRPPETAGWTPLIAAAAYGCDSIVKSLLDANADTEIKAADGLTALEHAVQNSEDSGDKKRAFRRTIKLLKTERN